MRETTRDDRQHMLRHCFFCSSEFDKTEALDSMSRGARIATDPHRGRLWLICKSCGGWNLLPLETRWEVIEELERALGSRARLLSKGQNIALWTFSEIEVIRVGQTARREEAWWRYMKEAQRRVANAHAVVKRGKWKDALWTTLLFGLPLPGLTPAEKWISRARYAAFGNQLWHGETTCDTCGSSHGYIPLSAPLTIWRDEGSLIVSSPCGSCNASGEGGKLHVPVEAAAWVARRALAHANFAGPDWQDLNTAVHRIDHHGAHEFVSHMAASPVEIGTLTNAMRTALEIALNESNEAELLQMQARELETQWRREEQLACIIDRELSPP